MKDKRLGNPLQRQGVQNTIAAIIAILIGMLVGLIVLLFTDASRAGEGMMAILTGGLTDLKNMGQVLYYATPLIMTGLSVGFAKKTGLFNIGAPGQYMMGAFAAVYVGVKWTFLPAGIHCIVAVLAACLFGNIVTVTDADVAALGVLTLLLVLGALLWLRPVMYVAFDREFARSQGIAVRGISYAMAALTAVTLVLAIRVMGIVLLLSLLTIPAVAMNALSTSFRTITAGAAVLGAVGGVIGLAVSYEWEIPSGVAVIFVLAASLIAAKLLSLLRRRAKIRHA